MKNLKVLGIATMLGLTLLPQIKERDTHEIVHARNVVEVDVLSVSDRMGIQNSLIESLERWFSQQVATWETDCYDTNIKNRLITVLDYSYLKNLPQWETVLTRVEKFYLGLNKKLDCCDLVDMYDELIQAIKSQGFIV